MKIQGLIDSVFFSQSIVINNLLHEIDTVVTTQVPDQTVNPRKGMSSPGYS